MLAKLSKIPPDVRSKMHSKMRAAAYGISGGSSREDWEKLFRKIDKDGSGDVSKFEFRKAVRLQLKIRPDDVSDAEVDKFFQAFDDDGSGDVAWEEIVTFLELDDEEARQSLKAVNQ